MFLVSAAEMREIDQKAQAMGIPALILMENAGRALAFHTERLLGKKGKVAILAGPGQNGGDGFSAARHLSSRGHRVRVGFFGKREKLPKEASQNLEMLREFPVEILECDPGDPEKVLSALEDTDIIVDALLGTGSSGNPRPPLDVAIRWANSKNVPKVACDLPSGLSADTGWVYEPCIRADVTVTMGFPKIGLYSYPGRMFCGEIVVEGLGLPPALSGREFHARAVTLDDARAFLPRRNPDHHKGQSGHVTVVAGSLGMAGAAVLSAKAALRAGAGTVTLLCPGRIYEICASMVPEVMVLPCGDGPVFGPEEDILQRAVENIERSSAVVVGPGFGRGNSQAAFLKEILPSLSKVPCVMDADALFALKQLGGLSYLAGYEGNFILTPHPGELSRLLDISVSDLGKDRPGYARRASLESKSVVCLKGAGTCVADPSGHLFINTSGDPAMATAGSGDVLTGVIAALAAQGLTVRDSAWLGVFWHGLSGEKARLKKGSYGILAGDIIECLPESRKTMEILEER
ncbi:MAG TPA: NAD(P)H-hydrate dehydratase [Firmicutes bacterium]|nr:NAD(P)H-hydrate dehydratase [Candidatus Fermentithermobacillaceae bacterium]